jgi:hypothetical protein
VLATLTISQLSTPSASSPRRALAASNFVVGSPLLGSVLLSVINAVIFWLLGIVGIG